MNYNFSMAKQIAGLLFLIACAAPAQAASDDSHITYGCDDLVVVGRLNNLTYDLIEDPDDLLGHGVVNARVRIKQVLHGSAGNRVDVRYVAHAMFIESDDFLLVLKPQKSGTYWLDSANLMDDRFYLNRSPPVLASRCSKTISEKD